MDTPCTSILLATERDTTSTSILLAVERDTTCVSAGDGKGYKGIHPACAYYWF
jgi:hypothetical protein